MIPKNRITTSILTGASVASATVILSLFEPDRFVIPAVLATVILVFCAPLLDVWAHRRIEGRTQLSAGRGRCWCRVRFGDSWSADRGAAHSHGCRGGAAGRLHAGNRPCRVGFVEGGRSFHADIARGVGRQGGLGDVGCGRLFSAQRHLVRSGVGCCSSDRASALPCP